MKSDNEQAAEKAADPISPRLQRSQEGGAAQKRRKKMLELGE